MVRIVSLSVLLTLIVILGLTFFQVLAPFLLPLFLAGVFAVLSQPLFKYFIERTRRRVRLAAALTTGTVMSGIMVPVVLITVLTSLQLFAVATGRTDDDWARTIREQTAAPLQSIADLLNSWFPPPAPNARESEPSINDPAAEAGMSGDGVDAGPAADALLNSAPIADAVPSATEDPSADMDAPGAGVIQVEETVVRFTPEGIRARIAERSRAALLDLAQRSLGAGTIDLLSSSVVTVVSAIVAFLVFVVALYYFLADGPVLLAATEKLIPVHVQYQREVLDQFARVVRSVVMATLLAAVVQALATVAALWAFGFDHLLVLLVLCIFMAMIPMMGTWLVWGSCALWLVWTGHWIQGLLLALYGMAVIGLLDNVVRTYVLNTNAKLHPLLALISVLGGLKAMGLWGIFIGPIVASCLHALVQIFNIELSSLSHERFAMLQGSSEPQPAVLPNAPPPATSAQHAAATAARSTRDRVHTAQAVKSSMTFEDEL